jgi:hypothetical protein
MIAYDCPDCAPGMPCEKHWLPQSDYAKRLTVTGRFPSEPALQNITPHTELGKEIMDKFLDANRHDALCETELTSHGYTPCRCEERARICNCGRPYDRTQTITDECESCYELRLGLI